MTTWDKQFWSYLDYLRHTTRIEEISDLILSLSYLKYLNDNPSKYELDESAKWELFTYETSFGPILKKVQRAFETLEYCHPSLDNTFSNLDIRYDNYFLSEPRHTRELIEQISRFDFSFGKDFSEYFDDLLFYFNSSYGKRGAGEIQPKELTHLMHSLIPNTENQSIYNPFAGYASFGLNIPKGTQYVGEEINERTAAIARLRLAIDYSYKSELNSNDCIRFADKGSERKFTTIIFNPPF
ncbi:N-6 DNA methylase, partial [Saccharicrinis fermentans]